jgi:hypothetical protein
VFVVGVSSVWFTCVGPCSVGNESQIIPGGCSPVVVVGVGMCSCVALISLWWIAVGNCFWVVSHVISPLILPGGRIMVETFLVVGDRVRAGGCGMPSGVIVGGLSRVVVIVPPLILARCGMIVLAVLCLLGLGPTSSHPCSSIHRLALLPRILVFCFFAASHRNLGN